MNRDDGNDARLAQHARLVDALLRHPRALAVPASDRTLLQTAISSLIVAGDEVFKLRKPLQLGFLDFSTPALRRTDCEEELRLNRRTAARLYLDVQPVTGSIDAPRLGGGPAEAIDWALRMRRFDDSKRLDRLADQGRLDAATIDALAAVLADFHSALPASPSRFGHPQTVRRWALENFDALHDDAAARTHEQRLHALREWTASEFDRIAPLLAARRDVGWVRECHGDLHLGNLVLIDGQPLPFDALEFSAQLRHTDVMADLAFVFMDLQRHALPALAWRLVNAHVERTGDHGGLATLRFFSVYRAMVRAKVALLRAAQHDDAARAAFERDLRLAEILAADPAQAPCLVLTSGLSGSGKSTVAQMLVESLGAVRLRSDVERKRLLGMAPRARADTPAQRARLYGAQSTEATYARLETLAAMLLDAGIPAVVDAAFLERGQRQRMRSLAAAHGVRAVLIECRAPEAVLRRRLRQRQAADNDASDAGLEVLDRQLRRREAIGDDERPCRIDTNASPAATRAAALRCVGIA